MLGSVGLIPRKRLQWIPRRLQFAHEYCFFLHDEAVRALAEYEAAEANAVSFKFRDKNEARRFNSRAAKLGPIQAMRDLGYHLEAREVILNQITFAMVSDCMHHIFEGLRCLEKRKVVVAMNLMRKPLTDNLLYLAWIAGDAANFYDCFVANSPRGIAASIVKARRQEIIESAIEKIGLRDIMDADLLNEMLFKQAAPNGLQRLFQHAVHLVTVQRPELLTEPENFNFIFWPYEDDDLYELIYGCLPLALLFLSQVILALFERMKPPDPGSLAAFRTRALIGFGLSQGYDKHTDLLALLEPLSVLNCETCGASLNVTPHNAARLALTDTYRCSACRRIQPFPLSWLF